MKLEVRSVFEHTLEWFIFIFSTPPPPQLSKTLHLIFNKLTTDQKRSDLIQTRKERRTFWHCQLTSTLLVPKLGAEPHQLQCKASELGRKESCSEQGKVWVAGLPLGIMAELKRLVCKEKPSHIWGNMLVLWNETNFWLILWQKSKEMKWEWGLDRWGKELNQATMFFSNIWILEMVY